MKPDPDLKRAHEDETITAPRWVFDILASATNAVADSDAASDDLRRDCRAAVGILQAGREDADSEEADS